MAELRMGRNVTGVCSFVLLALSTVQVGDTMCLEKEERWGGSGDGRKGGNLLGGLGSGY